MSGEYVKNERQKQKKPPEMPKSDSGQVSPLILYFPLRGGLYLIGPSVAGENYDLFCFTVIALLVRSIPAAFFSFAFHLSPWLCACFRSPLWPICRAPFSQSRSLSPDSLGSFNPLRPALSYNPSQFPSTSREFCLICGNLSCAPFLRRRPPT
jgi:hypothetical protein